MRRARARPRRSAVIGHAASFPVIAPHRTAKPGARRARIAKSNARHRDI